MIAGAIITYSIPWKEAGIAVALILAVICVVFFKEKD